MGERTEKRDVTVMDNKYTYKKLRPGADGRCEEEKITVANTSRFNDLFPFSSGRRLHIFCIYLEGIPFDKINDSPTYSAVNDLWKNELIRREAQKSSPDSEGRVPTTNCEPDIPIYENFQDFIDLLCYDMANKGCMPKQCIPAFKDFLSAPSSEKAQLFYNNSQTVDVALIYFISEDTYRELKEYYRLPRRNSAVIKIIEKVLLDKDDYKRLLEDSEKYHIIKEAFKSHFIDSHLKNNQIEIDIDNYIDSALEKIRQNDLLHRIKPEDKTTSFKDDNL